MSALNIEVMLRGPLFTKKIDDVVADALIHEALDKVEERMERSAHSGGRNALGRRRNIVTQERHGLTLDIASTLRNPRQTGRSWQDKNTSIIKSMTRNVLRKAAQRMAGEL